jgi:hypothetical protein
MAKFRLHQPHDPPHHYKTFTSRRALLQVAHELETNGIAAEVFERAKDTGKWVPFQPTAYCRRCGRRLTNLTSVKNGLGPECQSKPPLPTKK